MKNLVEYIRDSRGHKIGVLFAKPSGTNFTVGYSLCSKEDVFDRKFGKFLAERRAEKFEMKPPYTDTKCFYKDTGDLPKHSHTFPPSIMSSLHKFISRCSAYYQDLESPYWYKLISSKD